MWLGGVCDPSLQSVWCFSLLLLLLLLLFLLLLIPQPLVLLSLRGSSSPPSPPPLPSLYPIHHPIHTPQIVQFPLGTFTTNTANHHSPLVYTLGQSSASSYIKKRTGQRLDSHVPYSPYQKVLLATPNTETPDPPKSSPAAIKPNSGSSLALNQSVSHRHPFSTLLPSPFGEQVHFHLLKRNP